MRILLVGPGVNRKYGDKFYYSTSRRLLNGFIRNGHMVLHVSDRDLSDYALGLRSVGRFYAQHRIAQIAAHVRPHLVVLLLANMLSSEWISRLRRKTGARVVNIELDPLASENVANRFSERLDCCDAGFVTTGGGLLKQVARGRAGYFIPNLVDTAIDDQCAYDSNSIRFDVFFAGQQNSANLQWQRALALREALPNLSYCYAGASKVGGLWGHDYIAAQGASRVGLCLNRFEGDLYASDRMAQFLGNGMLLATDRASGYADYFGDDEMLLFSSVPELARSVEEALSGAQSWRERARKGREKAKRIMSSELVCNFIERRTFDAGPTPGWVFA